MKCLAQRLTATGLSLAVALSTSIGACADFYVATNGNDAWSGLLSVPTANGTDGPFATLEAARNAVRSLKSRSELPVGGVRVNLRGGRYMRQSSFALTPYLHGSDSGTPSSPIVYQAYPGETPCIIGGINVTGFQVVTDPAILARLTPPAQSHVLVANLTANGITNILQLARHGDDLWWDWIGQNELYFKDQPMQLARWPNTNWLNVASAPAPGSDHFSFTNATPSTWVLDTNIWVQGYFGNNWSDDFQHVASIVTTNGITNKVTITAPQASYGYVAGGRFYFLNVLEELDSPGEYYIDRVNNLLYFWPPSSIAGGNSFISTVGTAGVPSDGGVISHSYVSNIVFSGISCIGGVGSLFSYASCKDNLITNCTLIGSSCDGVDIFNSSNITVTRCNISFPGEFGIWIWQNSSVNRTNLTSDNISIIYNRIHDFSRLSWTYTPAIYLSDVGNYVAYNLIYNAPHLAIRISGNNHIVELNEIHNVCKETSDAGAIYMYAVDWTYRGNIICYNYIHDVTSYHGGGETDVVGIYLDAFISGTLAYGNIFANVDAGFEMNGGRDNVFRNNIFVGCHSMVGYVNQCGFGSYSLYISNTNSSLWTSLNAMPYKTPPWSTQYPELVSVATNNPAAILGTVIANNISYDNALWINWYNGAATDVTVTNNFTSGDPLFVNYSQRQFGLSTNSPAWAIGFQPIPMNRLCLVPSAATGLRILGPPQ